MVGHYEADNLMFGSSLRNGFVPRLRREVWSKLKVTADGGLSFA
jgi:hypothetical protein